MILIRICLAISFLICISCNYRFFDDIVLPEIAVTPEGDFVSKVEPNFQSINEKILQPKCVGCHNSQGSASDLPFENHADLIAGIFINAVIPGDSENSPLYQVIQPDARRRMPPRSSTVTPLTTEQIQAIQTWIDTGALP